MPELPEVETIVRDLRARIPGSTIRKVSVTRPDILASGTAATFQRRLRGRRIERVERRAKSIVLQLDDTSTLAVSLGMTGRLVAAEAKRASELRHVAVRFDLDDGRALLYDDARRFGRLQHFPPGYWQHRDSQFGLEPLSEDFTAARLFELTRRSRSPMRNWLLDPYRVAGVGNIYANEALFRARVRPTRRAHKITRAESVLLHDALRAVLQQAIDRRGTTLNNYRDASGEEGDYYAQLQVYGREAEPCVRCRTPIKRIVLSNRSAYYCPKCQR
ncbi:MAG: bifunctional DNA-formamidopyrimidine glycosylase/DNA-(apurinic or apyrimidinic site) lyase [Longimicrobiales bacterium]